MDRRSKHAVIISALLLISNIANASNQSDHKTQTHPIRDMTQSWFWGFTLEQFNFDSAQSEQEGISDSGLALGMDGEYFFTEHFSTHIGFGFLQYDDKASFSQTTEDNYGNVENSSSDANALLVYGDLGYKHLFKTTFLGAHIGMTQLIGSERSIGYCSNCASENIDIDGGFYAALSAGFKAGETWGLGLIYKNYFTGDIDNSIGLELIYGF